MKKIYTIALSGMALAFMTSTAIAIGYDELVKFDTNKNKKIDPGSEHQTLISIADQLTTHQLTLLFFEEPFKPGGPGMLVKDLTNEPVENGCNTHRRFFLTDKAVSQSLFAAGFDGVAGNAASFSSTENYVTGDRTWKVDGALTWAVANPCLPNDVNNRGGTDLFLSAFAIAPFVEFHGSGSNTATGVSTLRFGMQSEFELFSGGIFDNQLLKINPYFQTDFEFDAEIFGLQAAWTPIHLDVNLNSTKTTSDDFKYWWNFQGLIDYHNVKKVGNSGLSSSTNYGWVGANITANFEYLPESSNGIYGSASLELFHDVVASQSVDKFTTELGIYLDDTKKNSFSITYEDGTNYQDLSSGRRLSGQFKASF